MMNVTLLVNRLSKAFLNTLSVITTQNGGIPLSRINLPLSLMPAQWPLNRVCAFSGEDQTMAEARRKLDIASKSLRTWKEQFERGDLKGSLGASKLSVEQHRIRELERELAIAKMERDILKKVTELFARESK